VTDGALTNPTVAAFYAHANNAKQPQDCQRADRADAVDMRWVWSNGFKKESWTRPGSRRPQFASAGTNHGMATARLLGLFAANDLPLPTKSRAD